jgi:hypothetical protein
MSNNINNSNNFSNITTTAHNLHHYFHWTQQQLHIWLFARKTKTNNNLQRFEENDVFGFNFEFAVKGSSLS